VGVVSGGKKGIIVGNESVQNGGVKDGECVMCTWH
jgi:hypothetical protein